MRSEEHLRQARVPIDVPSNIGRIEAALREAEGHARRVDWNVEWRIAITHPGGRIHEDDLVEAFRSIDGLREPLSEFDAELYPPGGWYSDTPAVILRWRGGGEVDVWVRAFTDAEAVGLCEVMTGRLQAPEGSFTPTASSTESPNDSSPAARSVVGELMSNPWVIGVGSGLIVTAIVFVSCGS